MKETIAKKKTIHSLKYILSRVKFATWDKILLAPLLSAKKSFCLPLCNLKYLIGIPNNVIRNVAFIMYEKPV